MGHKYYKDNREFMNALKEYNDLVTIEQEVDWDMEMGAIVRRVCEKRAPAPYFKKIKDYPEFEAFGAPLATYKRLAIAMGMKPEATVAEISDEYVRRTTGTGIKPVLIDPKNAPCKEIIWRGKEVDLFQLPAPMVHGGDGGRYLATWHIVVTKDPDTGAVNWGMYRQMIFDEQTMVGPLLPFSDAGKVFYTKFVPKNKPMPFATVIGMDPLAGIAGCAPAPISEDEFTGMLMGEPVEVVKCETCDLEVPAHSEIVLEGEVLPNIQIPEAPFGEYTGYRTSPREPRTVYRVKAITMRRRPLLTVSNMGMPTDEGQLLRSFSLGLEMRKLLRDQGIPITGVYMLPESTHHMVVVGVKVTYSNVASQIANLVFGSKLSPWFHMVVVVDEDVDIYNKDEVIHALSTKCHPIRGIRKYEHAVGTPLYPFADPEDRKWSRGAQVLFDCTFPLDWPKALVPIKVSFNNPDIYPKEIQEKVLANWKNYGFLD